MAFDDVATVVRERVEPSADERAALETAVETLLDRVHAAIADLPVDAEARHVGSTARDTWISGDRDIDIFIRFSPDLSRDDLERHGLAVGHSVLPDGREEYADHPYVTGEIDGFDVDLVPCYAVESARSIDSPVDRTPFHSAYLEARLTTDLLAEIRVFKQFLKAIGVYGSDLRTEGFSGYLTELLVLEYASVKAVLEAAANWHPPVRIDPEGHGERSFAAPLVVIDPTDPTRNVAAVLSTENLARFQHYAREVLATPREELFFATSPEPMAPDSVRAHVNDRGTTPVAIVFDTPDLVDDELYPQLRKSLSGIGDELGRRGFDVFRQAAFANDRAVLLFELAVASRPRVERHEGPPVAVRGHAETFIEKYTDANVYGPFIDGNRYVVERPRELSDPATLLDSNAVFEMRLGPGIESALQAGYDVLRGEEIAGLAGEFAVELADYFDPSP